MFPVRVVPTKSSCHVILIKTEHLLRYSFGLCLTIIVKHSEDKNGKIRSKTIGEGMKMISFDSLIEFVLEIKVRYLQIASNLLNLKF